MDCPVWSSNNRIDWLKLFREHFRNATERSFKSAICVSYNTLDLIYHQNIPKCYPPKHLLIFYSFLRVYLVEDFAHAIWGMSKETYRKIIKNIRSCLKRLNAIKFSRIHSFDHPFFEKCNIKFYFIGVVDTFEAFLEKPSNSSYWWRHRFISKKKGNRATFKYQVVVHPLTGEINHLSGCPPKRKLRNDFFGREHDSSICVKSGVLDELRWASTLYDDNLCFFGDEAYKGFNNIVTKKHVGEGNFCRELLNRHRNSVERIIGYIRRFQILNVPFRHEKKIHSIYTNIIVHTCQMEIQNRGIFKLKKIFE